MNMARPNVRKVWRTCPNCLLAYMGTGEGLCPNCLSLCTVSVSPPVAWSIVVGLVTALALAILGLSWLVMR
jgi:hypothetical protein